MEVNETRNCLVTDILQNIRKSAESLDSAEWNTLVFFLDSMMNRRISSLSSKKKKNSNFSCRPAWPEKTRSEAY